jgi:hypothetical protein
VVPVDYLSGHLSGGFALITVTFGLVLRVGRLPGAARCRIQGARYGATGSAATIRSGFSSGQISGTMGGMPDTTNQRKKHLGEVRRCTE